MLHIPNITSQSQTAIPPLAQLKQFIKDLQVVNSSSSNATTFILSPLYTTRCNTSLLTWFIHPTLHHQIYQCALWLWHFKLGFSNPPSPPSPLRICYSSMSLMASNDERMRCRAHRNFNPSATQNSAAHYSEPEFRDKDQFGLHLA